MKRFIALESPRAAKADPPWDELLPMIKDFDVSISHDHSTQYRFIVRVEAGGRVVDYIHIDLVTMEYFKLWHGDRRKELESKDSMTKIFNDAKPKRDTNNG